MAIKAEQLKIELTEKVAHQVREKVQRDKAEAAERFVRQFYANVPVDDILQASQETLYGAALSIWQFGAQRQPGTARVRLYNPQVASQGWGADHTIVEIINDDMPFLVDSVTAELNRHGLTVHLVIHPVVRVRRDAEGRLVDLLNVGNGADDGRPESFMHIQVSQETSPERMEEVRADIERVLADVRAAVEDWKPLRERALGAIRDILKPSVPVSDAEKAEAEAFLRWLDADNFTFLGYREYMFEGTGKSSEPNLTIVPEAGLGVLRNQAVTVFDGLRNFATLPPDVRHFLRQPSLLLVTKTHKKATVHRPSPMDGVFVKLFDDKGNVVGERLIMGLFTSAAYSRSAREVPFVRQKIASVVERAGFDPRSHNGKALIHILETFPRDELFQITTDELYDISIGILHLQERQRTALFVRRDPFERFVSCLVYLPRDRYDSDLRRRAIAILERAFGGKSGEYTAQVSDSALARLHVNIRTEPGKVPAYDIRTIEEELKQAARSWTDLLQTALVAKLGEGQGLKLARRYGTAFPAGYKASFSAEAAVFDIDRIEATAEEGKLALNLFRPLEAAEQQFHFKVYHDKTSIPLSDILPMMENMGLKVLTEVPFEVRPEGREESVWIHDFATSAPNSEDLDLTAVKEPFQEAFTHVWAGEMENDSFNRLILLAGLRWREVVMLRAYAKYLRQARFAFTQETIADTLAAHPKITQLVVRLFEALHDPALAGKADGGQEIQAEIERALEAVTSLDEDRILRRYVNLVNATLRTNFYQHTPEGLPKAYVSFKLNSQAIDDLPAPRPWVEIFVYSPRVEAIHLRGGKVARGGIRWSDRREDFRTEILGLLKAQMVKNTVIVPVGSKGGFVVKHMPPASAGRDVVMAEVIECYKTLMRGMLDITDNLVSGAVVPPKDVVRRDEDDPYLVVAADKGTATFSDIANSVSLDYGFWLGDAFASGGSKGYDHKKMGITARGGWEAVKRHFREMGRDIQTQDFTVVGVGDMSGDVFGNGMLLSKHICLLGAFDHRHIFCDPNPDPAISFAERERMFALPRSSWADYDASKISKGGAVFDRAAKSLTLTPEIRACFGIEAERVTPAELMQAMLRAETDLLWFGGIGTFLKASHESHADVGDKANDAIRINGSEVRAKVIGEGANLGVTQDARIEFALNGGRINTDAIDNSAGVDTSDHEVNIKILLNDVVQRGDMTLKQRDELLESMTDEVAGLVLSDNYLQTQELSVSQAHGTELLEQQARFIRALERSGMIKRSLAGLPSDDEIAERALVGKGLTRPELAVVLAYGKITHYDDLLASALPDEPVLVNDLLAYFPTPLQKNFRPVIERHRLRREIIATHVVNSLNNRVGPTFVMAMMDKTGMGPDDVARAYLIAREVFGLPELWQQIEAQDLRIPAEAQTRMLLDTQHLLERTVAWLLTNSTHPLAIEKEIPTYRPGVETILKSLDVILCNEDKAQLAEAIDELTQMGIPEALARRVAALPILASATDVTRIAAAVGSKVEDAAKAYFTLGRRLGLDWLRAQASRIKTENHWQRQAVSATVDELYGLQGQLAARVLQTSRSGKNKDVVDQWVEGRRAAVDRAHTLLSELRTVATVDVAMLAVANRQLRGLIAG